MPTPPNRIAELRTARGWSQERLAELADTSNQQISMLEKGQRRLTVEWMERIGDALGVDAAELLVRRDAAPHESTAPPRNGTHRPEEPLQIEAVMRGELAAPSKDRIPVLAAAMGGPGNEVFLQDGPIDYISRPDSLGGTREAYAMVVTGDSMIPMFCPKQIIHVDPFRKPVRQRGVVIWKSNNSVLVKEFVSRSDKDLVVREYQPKQRDFKIPLNEIKGIHRIVGAQDE